jgi:hypothetical protein
MHDGAFRECCVGIFKEGPTAHRVTLDEQGQLVLKSNGEPAYRLAPEQGRWFRIVELEGFAVEFSGEATIDELIFHQPNGTFVAERVKGDNASSAGRSAKLDPTNLKDPLASEPPLVSKPHCYCLIPDVSGNAFLAMPAGERLWTLPTVEHDDGWFPHVSTAVARSATERYGIPMTALREHTVADCRVCELEIHALQWTPPAGTRWIASSDLAATTLEPAALSALLRAWFCERESGAIPAVRPAWERSGWYAEAVRWILSECTRLGYAPSGPIEQLKAAWSWSSILRVNSSVGFLYFKADRVKPPSEPAVIDALARRWPRNRATIHRELIVALAARHRLPAVYPARFDVLAAGLVSYGPVLRDQYRSAADYVDRILRGAKPEDLPVQAPTKYELVLNMKTAKALGIEVSWKLLALADEVIE